MEVRPAADHPTTPYHSIIGLEIAYPDKDDSRHSSGKYIRSWSTLVLKYFVVNFVDQFS